MLAKPNMNLMLKIAFVVVDGYKGTTVIAPACGPS